MPQRKTPYRLRYKKELTYPDKGGVVLPSHGGGPRCKVNYDPNDDGPWTTVRILRIDDDDDVEEFTCAMPRHYAIPLILINKQLAFYEAQCHPDGTPLPPSSSCGIKQRELREYSYLWHLRCRFLQAIFDMNYDRFLDERWRYDGIHGFLHRMYRRFGHDRFQRLAYWREENKKGRVPYTVPDIAEMDWKAYLLEDMTTSTCINAFLWNRVSQGYSRVVKDEPPFERWRAWRAGYRDNKPVPYLTPTSSPVREMSSELDGVSAAAAVAEQATQGSSLNCGARGYDTDVRTVTAPPMLAAATVAAAAAAETAIGSRSRRGVGVVVAAGVTGNGDGDGDEEAEELEYAGYEDVTVLTTALTGPPNSQEWALPFPSSSSSELSQSSSSSSSSRGGGGGTSQSSMSTNNTSGRLFRQRQISFKLNAPEDMELAVIHCTFTRTTMEDVKDFKTELKVAYAENLS